MFNPLHLDFHCLLLTDCKESADAGAQGVLLTVSRTTQSANRGHPYLKKLQPEP